ncbi:hypothetical protein DUI87_14771 [Hirundo rustica rustica]|uniref:WD repeat-containing protein 63 n=1 Tax=Hirundo rustica rustica TaxID=333673 RepID=A0A3M0K5U6_HIRRU|nr:hypothetical protein DUI87_14771 [Hirundo rustica rustica]
MSENLKSSKTTLKGPKTTPKKQKGKKDEVDLSMASIGHPEIFPLLLTAKTQEIFNCRSDEDVTEENCFKCIKKEDIIQDLKTRAKTSDFHPLKKVILEYPGEELLLVFDPNFQYGQNFYIVASEEAKENLLKSLATEEEREETEENREETLEVHKPWVSLGSEKEVEEESVKERDAKIKYKISRVRRKFGAPITFTNKNASDDKDSYAECTAYKDDTFSIKMLERDVGVQMVPKLRETSTQTKWTYPKNASTQYFPRELSDEAKAENLSSETLKDFLTAVHLRMEIALQQNEIMNVFFDDWKALAEDQEEDKPDVYLKAYQSFTDVQYLRNRTISCVRWHPTIYGIIALSASEQPLYEEQVNLSNKSLLHQSVILLLSFFDPICLQLVLKAPEDIYCFQFSPSDPNIIAGGCVDGQVVLWDISKHEEKLLSAKPVADEIIDSSEDEPRAAAEVTEVIPGLMDGEIVYSKWKKKIDTNSAKPVIQKYSQKYALHTETINTLQKSPFFKDIFLSIGGQKFAIWKEGVTHANILDYFEREAKYLNYCEQEFKEYQKFQAKTELKCSWRQRKQYVILGIEKIFYVSLYL